MKKGNVLCSFTDASKSTSLPRFLREKNNMIGAVNPNIKATEIVITCFNISDSSINAKSVKTIIVKEGGTKRIEIIRASLFISFDMLNLFQHH